MKKEGLRDCLISMGAQNYKLEQLICGVRLKCKVEKYMSSVLIYLQRCFFLL